MTVSLTPALSQRARGTRSALRATFTVTLAALLVRHHLSSDRGGR
jgi:hypothetical protein